jgi:hypothetical protein
LNLSLEWLAQRIRTVSQNTGTKLVAVDGPSASGKSTFASKLSNALQGTPIIYMDDFLAWEDLTDYWPRFEKEVLGPLLSGKRARYQVREREKDPLGRSLGPWRETPASPLYILEGIGSARREIWDRLACAIWMETPPPLRIERFILREGEEWRSALEKWQVFEEQFFEKDGTRSRVHLRVDGIDGRVDNFKALEVREPFGPQGI